MTKIESMETRAHISLHKQHTAHTVNTGALSLSPLNSSWLPIRSPLILGKHSVCLVSDLWLLESLSHALKRPCTPELILGAKHCRPNLHSPKSSFTISFHSNCFQSTSRLTPSLFFFFASDFICLWVHACTSPPHLCVSGVLKARFGGLFVRALGVWVS